MENVGNNLEYWNAFLDSFPPITEEQLKQAYRNSVTTELDALHVSRAFRNGQPGTYNYIPYRAGIPDEEAEENGKIVCDYILWMSEKSVQLDSRPRNPCELDRVSLKVLTIWLCLANALKTRSN